MSTTRPDFDPLVFGQHLRHHRRRAGLTLAELGALVGRPAPYLSQLENGHAEPKLSLIGELGSALGVEVAELVDPAPPTRRAALEVALLRAQEDERYRAMRLPYLKPSARLPDDVLEHLVRLYDELTAAGSPPDAPAGRADPSNPSGRADSAERSRRAGDRAREVNAQLRQEMRDRDNYFGDIERLAAEVLAAVGYTGSGPISERTLLDIADHFGFSISRVLDLPRSARSITDQRARVIFIPQRNDLPTRAARSVVLQTLGHFALGHRDTDEFGDYLRQRVESNYFAAAILAPEGPAVSFLGQARDSEDLSVEDLKEVFYISYEMAAHRLTNLATRHLGIQLHFLRSDEEGVVWKAYENDDVPLPAEADGTLEGQKLCRHWGTRQAFASEDSFALHYQYTDTPSGPFWCVTHVEAGRSPLHAVTVGCRAEDARWFRGNATDRRSSSGCPDPSCCREPSEEHRTRWEGIAWPSARDRSHVLSGLPVEGRPFTRFPGVDLRGVYEFLDRHSSDASA